MNNEVRLVVAVALMIGVVLLTNVLFPSPEVPTEAPVEEGAPAAQPSLPDLGPQGATRAADTAPGLAGASADVGVGAETTQASGVDTALVEVAPFEDREIVVEGPLWRYSFSTVGARLVEATLTRFDDLAHPERDPVQLLPEGSTALGRRLVLGSDTLDLAGLEFVSDAPDVTTLGEGDAPLTLEFSYTNRDGSFGVEVDYTFDPAEYVVGVDTRLVGVERPVLLTSLGRGIAYTEADSAQEARTMAYVNNRLDGGIKQRPLQKVSETEIAEGPLFWTAIKSKYFVVALLPGTESEEAYVGGVLARPTPEPHRALVEAATGADAAGLVRYRMYLGPQEYSRLKAIGNDFQEVNPYGWAFFRAIVRPFVGIIVAILTWAHDTLSIGYGWVLILFGVALRIVLWPLNAKAMRAQIKNMAVQPLVKEIQTRYKDQPEKLQKELMKLYKEHGFNPLGGCLPMLIPYPFLIALFFVFQNAIELRGVPFLWLPDLSAKDPLFILPAMLALSMFLIQWITYRSMPSDNPQMKMMMWFMPIFLGVIFLNFPSGLNLYYASMNVATLPQQVLIANERKKVKVMQPGGSGSGGGGDSSSSSSASGSRGKKSGKPRKARSRG
jgi:YidC/Oxa1 family membrane protein insertase